MCSQSDHIRMKRPSQFPKLPFVGVQVFGDESLELRNCKTCLSTLAVEIDTTERK